MDSAEFDKVLPDLIAELLALDAVNLEARLKVLALSAAQLIRIRELLTCENAEDAISDSDEESPPESTISANRFPSRSEQIGPYHILELLGEGGMGAVYKAEQRSPVKRIVALKLIKAGLDTAEVIA